MFLVLGGNHEEVANVNDECIVGGLNGVPFVVGEHLEAADLVLVEDGQACWVTVRPSSEGDAALLANWVAVQSHYGASIFEKLAQFPPLHS